MPCSANPPAISNGNGWPVLRAVGCLLIAALLAAPFLLCLWYVNAYSVDVPVYDQWQCVDVLKKLHRGEMNWLDVFLLNHGRHMCGSQFSVMAALAPLTGYNIRAEAFLAVAAAAGSFVLLAQMVRQRMAKGILAFAALIPIAWIVFSLRQNESLLGGLFGGLGAIAVTLFFVLTVYLLERVKSVGWMLFAAMIAGTLCSFTLFDGLLILPFGFVQLAANSALAKGSDRKKGWLALAVWTVFSAAVASCHFLHNRPLHSGMGSFLRDMPWESVKHWLCLLGSPLCPLGNGYDGLLIGVATAGLLLAFLILLARQPEAADRRMIAPAIFLTYTVVAGLLITAARAHTGLGTATTSRYASHCYLWVVGLYLLFLSAQRLSPVARRSLIGSLLLLIAGGSAVATADGLKQGPIRRDQHLIEANALRTYRLQQESQAHTKFPALAVIHRRQLAPFLEQQHLSVFREKMPQTLWDPAQTPFVHLDGMPGCPFEFANGTYSFTINDVQRDITITGWAVDRQSRGPVGGMVACLDGKLEIPMAYGLDRPDAVKHLRKRSYRDSGFQTSFGSAIIGNGSHTISFKILSPDKKSYYQVPQMIVLRGAAGG